MKIRQAESEDITTIIHLIRKAFALSIQTYGESPPGYDSWQKVRDHIDNKHCFVICDTKNTIVGGAIVYAKGEDSMYLSRIFIDPDCSKQGLGQQLMQYLFSQFLPIQIWTLHCVAADSKLHNFYTKLGFIKVGEETPGNIALSVYRKIGVM